MPPPTLVLVNPLARGGRAGQVWSALEPLMRQAFPHLTLAITTHPDQIPHHLAAAHAEGLQQVIAVGGDGTSHTVINALLNFPDAHFSFGQLPLGTGQDFARILGIPSDPAQAVKWLAKTPPQAIDIGGLESGGKNDYFLNIASAGISGAVDQLMDNAKRYPWTFLQKTVQAFLTFNAPQVQVLVDDEEWYEGQAWLVAVANGSTFGRGMLIAPDARPNDGLFEVILVKGSSRLKALSALGSVYSGKHIHKPNVQVRRGKSVRLISPNAIPLDLDGETETGNDLLFKVYPQALNMIWSGK